MTNERVSADESRLQFQKEGNGPPLILLHGWPLSPHTYDGLVQRLAKDYTCYRPRLPGSPGQPLPAHSFETFGYFAQLVKDMMVQQGICDAVLVGHDSGGTIARLLAAQAPERVRAMVLFNTELPGQVPWLVQLLAFISRLPACAWVMSRLLRMRWFRNGPLAFGGCFSDARRLDGKFFETTIRPLLRDARPAMQVLRSADWGIVHQLEALHQTIACPVLCVWGEDDAFFPLEQARNMVRRWPSAELMTLPRARLLVHEELPEEVASLILPFLRAKAANAAGVSL